MASGDYVISSGGGVRVIYSDALKEEIVETGISSLTGIGQYPTPLSTYRAVNRAMKMRPPYNERVNRYGKKWHWDRGTVAIIIRVTGMLNPIQNFELYMPEPGAEYKTYSRRISAYEAYDALRFILYDGGDGAGTPVPGQIETTNWQGIVYPNVYVRVISEITGFNWESVETVQFFY